ncbi:MAG TPA: hypothetical protein VEQ66_00080 [Propionibacteriaceae bacterium]|nr:hypothetical protein [Propionibacteriaceae bacterium]
MRNRHIGGLQVTVPEGVGTRPGIGSLPKSRDPLGQPLVLAAADVSPIGQLPWPCLGFRQLLNLELCQRFRLFQACVEPG